MNLRNRIHNSGNPYQGNFPRVLCVCSAGLLRSPTLAWVLSQEPFNCNTRAAGSEPDFALVPVDEVLISWADHIVFVNESNERSVKKQFSLDGKQTTTLNVPDSFSFRDPSLVEAIKKQLDGWKP